MITIFNLLGGFSGGNANISNVSLDFLKIQRTNAAISLSATVTGGPVVSCIWAIRDSAGVLKSLDFGTTVSAAAITTRGYYDLSVWITTATDEYRTTIRKAFFVNTPKFTEGEADLVINLASGNYYNDFAGADNTGLKIYVKGNGTGYFAPLNLWSLDPDDPVIIQKATGNTQIVRTGVSGSDGFNLDGGRNVIVDGYNDDGTQGFKLSMPTGSLFPLRCQNTAGFTGIKWMGIEVERTGASTDRADVSMIPPVNATYNATNWVDEDSAVWDCIFHGGGAECIYINYTNDTPQSTYIPPKSRRLMVCWNQISDAGNDAIQVASSIDSFIMYNRIDTWGVQASSSHENAFSINEGNARLTVAHNFAKNGKMGINMKSGLTPWDVEAGETTAQANWIYGNTIIEGTPPGGGGSEPTFNYFQTNGSSATAWPLHFFNNNIICNKLPAAIAFNSGAFIIPNLVWANNIIVSTGAGGDYPGEVDFTGAGTFPSSPTINNLVRTFASYSDIGFVNSAGDQPEDFRLTSTASPAFTGATNISSVVSGIPLIDFDSAPLNASGYNHGAYSGYLLKTLTPTPLDANAATFSVALAVGNLTDSTGDITYTANKEGMLFWSIVANNATAPTIAQLRAGGFGTLSGEILGNLSASTGSFSGLLANTAYDLYAVFVTVDGIEQAATTKVDFTTAADVAAPTLSGWEITNAQPGRIYFNSSEIITATTYGGFTISGVLGTVPTVTGITINTGSTTGHYLTVSANFVAADYLAKIAYSGSGSNLQDASANALASFTATSITNNITYSKRININITSFANNTGLSSWNDVDLAGNVSVRTLVANLDDINNTATGISFAIQNAFHAMQNAVNATAGTYISNANAIVRGIEVYHTPDASGTFRFAGLSAGQAFDIIYLIKNTFGTGAGNVNVNGAGAVGYTTGTVERKVSGTADGSGNIDWVITQTTSNTSECTVAMILIVYP